MRDRIVIKVGTSTISHKTGMLNLKKVERLTFVLSDIHNSGKEIVLVSSGAVGVGAPKLGFCEKPSSVTDRQAAAAVGQSELMNIYSDMFGRYSKVVGQLLLTRDVLEGEMRRNAAATFENLIKRQSIPIVNENDPISTRELEFGDNDTLSAYVSQLIGAELLIMLTDIDGMYDKNPLEFPNAKRIPVIESIDDSVRAMAGGAGSKHGTGGMITKVMAAEIAVSSGCDVVVASGENPDILYDIIEGKSVGTLFRKRA